MFFVQISEQTMSLALYNINSLNAELNPICHLLALLGGATIVVVSRLRVNRLVLYNRGGQCFLRGTH